MSLMNNLRATGNPPIELTAVGDINNVLAGRVPNEARQKINVSDYQCGFNIGSPKSLDTLGETCCINGICYSCLTNPDDDDFRTTQHGTEYYSTSLCLVDQHEQPTHLLEQHQQEINYLDLCQAIYKQIQQPFFIKALMHFSTCRLVAVSQAPIYSENIFTHKDKYYVYPSETLTDTHALVTGLVTDLDDTQIQAINRELEYFTYHNPLEDNASISAHSHCLILDEPMTEFHQINPTRVQRAAHLIETESTITNIHAEIFATVGVK